MKTDLQRRKFLSLTLLIGLVQIMPLGHLQNFAFALEDEDIYFGPLMDRVADLLPQFAAGEITQAQVLAELKARYQEIDIPRELGSILRGPLGTSTGEMEITQLHRIKLKNDVYNSKMEIQLFNIPKGCAHPPHGHSDLISLQTLVRGSLRISEYQRLADEPGLMQLSLPSQKVVPAGETFETTQDLNNVHWFGAEEDAIVLNLNVVRSLKVPAPTILVADSAHRIYVRPDQTPVDGIIRASVLQKEEADQIYSRQLPS